MKKNTSYTIGAVIVLLICAFCFVAVPAFTGSDGGASIPAFGKFNGREIKYAQGSDMFNLVAQDMDFYQYTKTKITEAEQKSSFENAFTTLVLKYAYDDYVKSSGYAAPSETVKRILIENYYSQNGEYSKKLYQSTDDDTKLKIQAATEESLLSARFNDDFFGSDEVVGKHSLFGLKESDAELDFLRDYNNGKRGFDMAVFNLSDFPAEEKIKFANENKDKFVIYDLSIITVNDKTTAESIARRIKGNEITFDDAFAEYSSSKLFTNSEGKFNWKYQYELEAILKDKADASKIAALEIGTSSDAIQTIFGYSVFRQDSAMKDADLTTDASLYDINSYINNYEKNLIEDYFISKANDFASNVANKDFAEACANNNAEYVHIDPFPLNFGSVDISESVNTNITGFSYADTDEKFLKTAFALSKDEVSSPMVMEGKCVVVLKYTEDGTNNTSSPFAIKSLNTYDQSDVNNAIFNSPKFVNNFSDVYKKYFK